MKKLRVLHFPFHRYGGPEIQLQKYLKYMDPSHLEFGIITRFQPTQEYQTFYPENCKLFPVTCSFQKQEFFEQIGQVIEEGFDICHLHTSHWAGGFPLEELAVKKHVPRIMVHSRAADLEKTTTESYETLRNRHEHFKALFSTELATDFAACSNLAADWLFGPQILRENIKIMHNAIDTQEFKFDRIRRTMLREHWELTDHFVIGHIGRIFEQKNPRFIVETFREIHRCNPKARLVWIGEGILEQEIRASASDLGHAIRFIGTRNDVADWMQVFDCFLLPSLFEGLPNVIVEAQAAGLPCFLSDRVTQETKLTDLVQFWPLEWSPAEWAEKILAYPFSEERPDTAPLLAAQGYEMRLQAKVLERYYLEGK